MSVPFGVSNHEESVVVTTLTRASEILSPSISQNSILRTRKHQYHPDQTELAVGGGHLIADEAATVEALLGAICRQRKSLTSASVAVLDDDVVQREVALVHAKRPTGVVATGACGTVAVTYGYRVAGVRCSAVSITFSHRVRTFEESQGAALGGLTINCQGAGVGNANRLSVRS